MGFHNDSVILGDEHGKVYSFSDLETKEKSLVTNLTGEVTCIDIKNNIIAISGEQANPVLVVDTNIKSLDPGHNGGVLSINISPNLQYVATIGFDGKLHIYDVNTKENLHVVEVVRSIKGKSLQLLQGDWSPDSSSYGIPGDMAFRYLFNKNGVWKYEPSNVVCQNNISIIKWVYAKIIVTSSLDKKIRVWNLEKDKSIHTIELGEITSSLAIFNKYIVVGTFDGKVEVYKDIEWGVKEVPVVLPELEETKEKESKDKASKYWFERSLGVLPQEPLVPVMTDASNSILY